MMVDRKDESLEILLGKIRMLMSRDKPERGAAIAALDLFIRDHGYRIQHNDEVLIDDDTHVEELGICERTCNALDRIDVWFVGQLRILTYTQLRCEPKIGNYVVTEIIRCLDQHGVTHEISLPLASSEPAGHSSEADPVDQLLDSWLKLQADAV